MKRALLLLVALSSGAAYGATARTFVSSTGVDTNPCNRKSPCRSFAAALLQTSPAGSVVALDSAGYGPVTISQSVSLIAAPGVYAGISATSPTTAIVISGASSTIVVLAGLSIEGGSSSSTGILVTGIHALHVRDCFLSGFTSAGIVFGPANAGATLYVSDTVVTGTGYGIEVASNTSHAAIDRTRAHDCQMGIVIDSGTATISHSSVAANTSWAIAADHNAQVSVDDCQVWRNFAGIVSQNGATIRVANSTITDNNIGLEVFTNGNLLSRIDDTTYPTKTNVLEHNNTDGVFTGTFVAQ